MGAGTEAWWTSGGFLESAFYAEGAVLDDGEKVDCGWGLRGGAGMCEDGGVGEGEEGVGVVVAGGGGRVEEL